MAIVGAGPAGLTLGLLLRRAGIESTILEARDRAYIERRMRAGLLEQCTAAAGAGARGRAVWVCAAARRRLIRVAEASVTGLGPRPVRPG